MTRRRPLPGGRPSVPGGTRVAAASANGEAGRGSAAAAADTAAPSGRAAASLSDREFEVLTLLRNGFSCAEIGSELAISSRTAWAHLASIKRKLNAATAAQCVARGFERTLLK